MSTPSAPVPQAVPTPALTPATRRRSRLYLVLGSLAVAALAVILVFWFAQRLNRSITDDAFVEAHIVNIAPQVVSGHIVQYFVDENDHVSEGQVLAAIDDIPYRDQVNIASSKVNTSVADLNRQEAALALLKQEVPIQIEIAQRAFAAASADKAKADETLKLTEDEVGHGIDEAKAQLDAANADLILAEQEYTRFTNLEKEEAVPLRRAQEVTRSRDSAQAHRGLAVAKLASAQADRRRIEVAKQSLEAAKRAADKAMKGVDLAETGHSQIREMELLVNVKKETVEDARRALAAAEDTLKYTRVRAPFPGVVVKRYRHLGDFAAAGVSLLSMFNPELMYVTANLEETRLQGVAPGNPVELDIDAFAQPFRGRVVWIDKSTGAQFALMPRNVVSGEFTKVVQRVPVRITIEEDKRRPLLRSGLSVRASIAHGTGDPEWALIAAQAMRVAEMRYNRVQGPSTVTGPENQP
jgi:membrane fusion protein (multidrug efflux system)